MNERGAQPADGRSATPRIVPVLVPHGLCGPGCPFCPPATPDPGETAALMPRPEDIPLAMLRYAAHGDPYRPTVLAFYGGSLPSLDHRVRAPLLDEAERQFRSGRVDAIRLTCDPARLSRVPLAELRSRGVRSLEVPLLSTEPRVLREISSEALPGELRNLMPRLWGAFSEVGITLVPGLPGDSHERAGRTARLVARLQPSYVRLLPALALEGTRLEAWWRGGRWDPMTLEQAVDTISAMLAVFREAGVPVIRVGLQPQFDLVRGPAVLEGPYHPSLRQLVESRLIRRALLEAAGRQPFSERVAIRFHPADEAYVRGVENATLRELQRRFRIGRVELVPDPARSRGRPRLEIPA